MEMNMTRTLARFLHRSSTLLPTIAVAATGGVNASLSSDVLLDCSVGGETFLAPAPGESLTITVNLDADPSEVFSSAVFRVVFTMPGLILDDYLFAAPFETGTFLDGSLPGVKGLPLSIQENTLEGPTWPIETADLLFDNFLITDLASPGELLELEISVPADFPVGESLFVAVVPEEIADGFEVLESSTGTVVELTIDDSRPADFNRDGVVNGVDLGILFTYWGDLPDPPADLRNPDINGDGEVGGEDFGRLLVNWG